MNVICFVDNRYGMRFNGRRLSRDRVLLQRVVELSQGSALWTDSFSRILFPDPPENLVVSENFLEEAPEGAFCLDEDRPLLPVAERIACLYLYCWNRDYPSDEKLDLIPEEQGMELVRTEDFPGYSHEKITLEVWKAR